MSDLSRRLRNAGAECSFPFFAALFREAARDIEERSAREEAATEKAERFANGLRFYANGLHFDQGDSSDWDSVSGEPSNFLCDSQGNTVEDGSIAKHVLLGTPEGGGWEDHEDWPPPKLPEETGLSPNKSEVPKSG